MTLTMNTKQVDLNFKTGESTNPIVKEAAHLVSIKDTETLGAEPTIRQNNQKARNALYALMEAGLYIINGITLTAAYHMICMNVYQE